ncbi:MAG TPA: hypothetical protein VGK24_09955 [Candidatus Angelobacter sp.]|jgi:hypothetical protein
MPLARIFTRNPERTAALFSELQQQGYKVEVAAPDQPNLAPADLEIEFEVCERADVLDRAANLASELGAEVAVAPGVLRPLAQPKIQINTQQTSEPFIKTVLEPRPQPAKPQPQMERDPEREFEAAFSSVVEMPVAAEAAPVVNEIQVKEPEPLPPVAFLEDRAALEPVAMTAAPEKPSVAPPVSPDPVRSGDPMPYLSQLTPFSPPTARTEEQLQATASPARQQKRPQTQERSNKALNNSAKIAAQTWAGALALAASTKDSVRNHLEEYKKRAQVRSAEAKAAHAARLLDLEQRRAEAHQRAAELEAARELAAARLIELVRQRGPGLPQENTTQEHIPQPAVIAETERAQSMYAQRIPQNRNREAMPADFVRPPADFKSERMPGLKMPVQVWQRINPPLRAVLTGAAAVTALFIMGIALGVFHSRPPLANTPNHASNGVTVQTGGVTVQAGAAKPQSAQTTAGTQIPANQQPGHTNVTPTEAKANTPAKPSPRVQAHNLVAEQSEKQIGDDVVIRHYSRPAPTQKPKQTGQQAGLKHFSDLDN